MLERGRERRIQAGKSLCDNTDRRQRSSRIPIGNGVVVTDGTTSLSDQETDQITHLGICERIDQAKHLYPSHYFVGCVADRMLVGSEQSHDPQSQCWIPLCLYVVIYIQRSPLQKSRDLTHSTVLPPCHP